MDDIALMREIARLQNQIDALRTIEVGGVWKDWTPTQTGNVTIPTIAVSRYMTIGKTCFINLNASNQSLTGTAGFMTISLPKTAGAAIGTVKLFAQMYLPSAYSLIRCDVNSSSPSTMYLSKNLTDMQWTAEETSFYLLVNGCYEMA